MQVMLTWDALEWFMESMTGHSACHVSFVPSRTS